MLYGGVEARHGGEIESFRDFEFNFVVSGVVLLRGLIEPSGDGCVSAMAWREERGASTVSDLCVYVFGDGFLERVECAADIAAA